MSVPAAALLAQGHPITLLDGTVVHVRFGMLGLYRLEQDFGGSAANAARHLQLAGLRYALARPGAAAELDDETRKAVAEYDGPGLVTVLAQILSPGLIGQVVPDRTSPDERVDLGEVSQYELLHYLDPRRLREYGDAFSHAFREAFDTGEAPAPAAGRASGSRSRTSTTSRAVKPTAPTSSSGA